MWTLMRNNDDPNECSLYNATHAGITGELGVKGFERTLKDGWVRGYVHLDQSINSAAGCKSLCDNNASCDTWMFNNPNGCYYALAGEHPRDPKYSTGFMQ